MEAYLKELQGTLARDAQRKKTMLNVHERSLREKRKNRFGVRPHNPLQIDDVEAAKFFYNQVRSEYNAKCRELIDAKFEALGENTTRQMNEAANKLMRDVVRWEKRVESLGGGPSTLRVNEVARKAYATGQTVFIGAAKQLPEAEKKLERLRAAAATRQATNTSRGSAEEGSHEIDDSEAEEDANADLFGEALMSDPVTELLRKVSGHKAKFLSSIDPSYLTWQRSPEEERELRKVEARFEQASRKQQQVTGDASLRASDVDGLARYKRRFDKVPSDEELRAQMMQEKKDALRAKLQK